MFARLSLLVLGVIGVLYGQAPAQPPAQQASAPVQQAVPSQGAQAPAEPTLTVLGALGGTPQEIKIQVVGSAVDQILLVQAPDKPAQKQVDGNQPKEPPPPDKIDVEAQVSHLLGAPERRWVAATLKWVDCSKGDKICNKTTFDWQGRKQLRLTIYGFRWSKLMKAHSSSSTVASGILSS